MPGSTPMNFPKPIVNKFFPIYHWLCTLLLGPLVLVLLILCTEHHTGDIMWLIVGLPFIIFFSAIFSLPVLAVNCSLFCLLRKMNIPAWVTRLVLIAVSVIGVINIQNAIGGTLTGSVIVAYSLASFFTGLLVNDRGNDYGITE